MGQPSTGTENSPVGGQQNDTEVFHVDMNFLLKTLRVDVPRFDGTNVENLIYKINKFLTLHQVEPMTLLVVVAFHLDGEPSMWY